MQGRRTRAALAERREAAQGQGRICVSAECGAEFEPSQPGNHQRFCSNKCRNGATYQRAKDGGLLEEKRAATAARATPCPYCGEMMLPPRKQCGADACRKRYYADRMSEYFRRVGGNKYRKPEVERASQQRVREKRKAAGLPAQNYTEGRKAASQRRRALKAGATAEKFTPLEIFERDNWKCGICHLKVRADLKYPHQRSASLDHIVPLAEGGEHTRANSRCSHLDCNVRRNKRGGNEQLMLV